MSAITCTCPHCGTEYTLGVNGTVDGCDQCDNIERNPLDGTIIISVELAEEQ